MGNFVLYATKIGKRPKEGGKNREKQEMGLLLLSRINEVCAGTRGKKDDQSGEKVQRIKEEKGGIRAATAGLARRRLSNHYKKDGHSFSSSALFPRASALQKESL